jgi:hypothetical protein
LVPKSSSVGVFWEVFKGYFSRCQGVFLEMGRGIFGRFQGVFFEIPRAIPGYAEGYLMVFVYPQTSHIEGSSY